ncbi:putative phosphatase YcdX [Vibrio stylophorae]|uniref:Phosphatase YcdX n=1 Tax=Vibrio stylophorae TaxID=659351 RepID=A0ABM8ZWP2_9VIBR|nr:phosphatase [Vibrio stylophorae]CAH0534755.1 putative phosphatase YcdX [Vibrio stylophorae]
MQLVVDTHTHTYASGHAYSTLLENAQAATEQGLQLFCTTDHAGSMPGAPYYWFFINQRVIPRKLHGVGVLRGVEANLLNVQGDIDIPLEVDPHLDWVIASFHEPVFRPQSAKEHTEALLRVIESGRVDALGHLGNPNFDFDFAEVVSCAKAHHVAIEINNSSLKGISRVGSQSRCRAIAEEVIRQGGLLTTGTDAHFCTDIGQFAPTQTLLSELNVETQQVITHSVPQFLHFLNQRGHHACADEFAARFDL